MITSINDFRKILENNNILPKIGDIVDTYSSGTTSIIDIDNNIVYCNNDKEYNITDLIKDPNSNSYWYTKNAANFYKIQENSSLVNTYFDIMYKICSNMELEYIAQTLEQLGIDEDTIIANVYDSTLKNMVISLIYVLSNMGELQNFINNNKDIINENVILDGK